MGGKGKKGVVLEDWRERKKREGEREGGREGGRKGKKLGWDRRREGGREEGRKGARICFSKNTLFSNQCILAK